MTESPVTVLAGGVGGARFLQGVIDVIPPDRVVVVGNVGDDVEPHGLYVSPDLDTVLYTLTGWIDEDKGWGVRGDSDRALERARELGADAWFWLGDLDIGLHLARTEALRRGEPLSAVTARIAERMGLPLRLIPATDDRLRTMIDTPDGEIDFQTYYVRHQHADRVTGIRFDGAELARPAPGVVEAIRDAAAIVIAPSNPLISIGPILAVPEIRSLLAVRSAPCVAVSPIVGGRALRGPAAAMLESLGHEASAAGVAAIYAGLVDALVIDEQDAELAEAVERHGMRAVVADTIMRDAAARERLARTALDAAGAVA
ncbi:MAG TPA: 2-phospho-L-lactate transferase [Gaiellales bacterium]|nr:2-phospho-L-lactate transferase [Gaiellales bacterium]